MADTEPCNECGVVDALGRHDPMCPYALRIGLPRLAEGEAPIPPGAEDVEALTDAQVDAEQGGTVIHSSAEYEAEFGDRPGAIERAPRFAALTELWFSYAEADGTFDDAVVFGSELEALRHAVTHGAKVQQLELGKSLRGQVREP